MTRAALTENLPGLRTPDDRRVWFLSPALIGRPILQNPWRAISKGRTKYPQSRMKEVLLSGCTANEHSDDALIGGTSHGAMTCYALEAVRTANYALSYAQLHSRLPYVLDDAGYPQHPQLEGSTANKKKQIFA